MVPRAEAAAEHDRNGRAGDADGAVAKLYITTGDAVAGNAVAGNVARGTLGPGKSVHRRGRVAGGGSAVLSTVPAWGVGTPSPSIHPVFSFCFWAAF